MSITALPVALVDWFTPPAGPGLPWGTPWLALLDTLRVLLVLGGVFVLWQCAAAIAYVRVPQQRAIYVALGLVQLVLAGTELDHLGDGMHYRFVLTLAVVAISCYGLAGISDRVQNWDGSHSRRRRR